jgi:hydrogenase/urease accessory protein HupE
LTQVVQEVTSGGAKGAGRRALFLPPPAWFLGVHGGVFTDGVATLPLAPVSIFILGVLVAADIKISNSLFTAIVLVVGFYHGVVNGVALKDGPGVLGLIGIMATLFVLVATGIGISGLPEAAMNESHCACCWQLDSSYRYADVWLADMRSGVRSVRIVRT